MSEVINGVLKVKPLQIVAGTIIKKGFSLRLIKCEGFPRIDCDADYARFINWINNECYNILVEGGRVVIELPIKPKDVIIKDEDYWKKRCELAEKYAHTSPGDPDVTEEQYEAFKKWQEFKIQ